MASTVWKFPFQTKDVNVIRIPKEAKVLCVQMQYDVPCIWALVDPEQEHEDVIIETFGTGVPIEGYVREYIGTYQLVKEGIAFVFHVFKKPK